MKFIIIGLLMLGTVSAFAQSLSEKFEQGLPVVVCNSSDIGLNLQISKITKISNFYKIQGPVSLSEGQLCVILTKK